jgi:hypothetical protein
MRQLRLTLPLENKKPFLLAINYPEYLGGIGCYLFLKFIDSPHFVSKRQITKAFDIKDQFVLKWLDDTLDDYRVLISAVADRVQNLSRSLKYYTYFTCIIRM